MGVVSKIKGVLERDGEHLMEAFMKVERHTTTIRIRQKTFTDYARSSLAAFEARARSVRVLLAPPERKPRSRVERCRGS